MKKIISQILLFVFCVNFIFALPSFAADIFKGRIEQTDKREELSKELYTGKVEEMGKGTKNDVIKMTVSQVLDGSFSLEGDEFFAEVTSDVEGKDGVIIPAGTVAHGRISEATSAKRLGRDGSLNLDFDYLVTPDGREIPIEGKMSTKLHPIAAGTKIIATDVGYTAAGGVVGGIVALNMFGVEAAIASQGYTVAGGAAIGGMIGLGAALYRKGKNVLISPGDEIRVKLNTKIPLPTYKHTAFLQHELKCPNLDINITNIVYEKDPFGELNTITLSLTIKNLTDMTFSSFDFALINDYNAVFHPSVFGESSLLFKQIKPGDRVAGRISFSVDNVKRKFWLTFYDRKTRKPVAKVSLNNAYKNVSDKTKKKNEKMFKKKNYYKNDAFDIEL